MESTLSDNDAAGDLAANETPRRKAHLHAIELEEMLGKRKINSHRLATQVERMRLRGLDFTKGVFCRALRAANCPVFKNDGDNEVVVTQAHAAKWISKVLYEKLRQPGQSGVLLDDFAQYMNPAIAQHGFALFDGNWDGCLTEQELYTSLTSMSRERRALRTALNDAESAIEKLDTAVTGFVCVILFISYFLVFNVDPNKVRRAFCGFMADSIGYADCVVTVAGERVRHWQLRQDAVGEYHFPIRHAPFRHWRPRRYR